MGVPADIIRHRPDIHRAERQLAAQSTRVGVATATLYPSLKLSSSIGLESLSLNHLFESASQTSRVGPGISWAIFDADQIRANIKAQSAVQDQDLSNTNRTVFAALNEVGNALTAYANEQSQKQSLKLSATTQKAVELTKIRYETELTDLTAVLDTQRSLLAVQDQLAQSDSAISGNLVRLRKALGDS